MKKLFTFALMVLLLVGIASAAWAGAAEEIAEAVQQRIHAFTEGNLEAWMAWYTDDAVVTTSTSPFRIEGKEALRTYYVGFFQAYPTRRVMSRQQSIRVYNGDTTAVTNAYFHVTLVDRNGQANTLYLRSSNTFVKQGGRWLVADAHTSRLPTSP
jgi:uncharacterized protein (TIGR02246 family)